MCYIDIYIYIYISFLPSFFLCVFTLFSVTHLTVGLE
jgi:hypothetical protein